MANAREIRSKIRSTQNMRKVTRALEMVSASKIRKAQDLMRASRPYAHLMRQVIGHVAHAHTEYRHPFMARREAVRRVGYLVFRPIVVCVGASTRICSASWWRRFAPGARKTSRSMWSR
ncbi:ATPase, F1 complex, gamma subunit [mine drainage metagenome]|uniref:ATPase, F1 complex, gamma subunit n=1 Tax=mine drainage metagenome TaxID=410659 RepID=T1B4N8_9ZZZZ